MAADPEWLEKLRSIRTVSRLSGDQVREGRDDSGRRFKKTLDELGNTVTQRHEGRQEVQDVAVRPESITVKLTGRVP